MALRCLRAGAVHSIISGHMRRKRPCLLWAKSRQQIALLFDHLVGASEQRRRHSEAGCLGSRKIDDEIEFRRLLDREIVRFRSTQNPIDIFSGTPKQRWIVWSIGQQRASLDKVARTND